MTTSSPGRVDRPGRRPDRTARRRAQGRRARGLPAPPVARGTVQARLERLQERGVITGYGPDVDPAALGYEVTAFITLEIRQAGGHDPVAERLAAIPEVLEVHTITGAGDMLCRVVARSNADLQRVLDAIVSTEGVVRPAAPGRIQAGRVRSSRTLHQRVPGVAVGGDGGHHDLARLSSPAGAGPPRRGRRARPRVVVGLLGRADSRARSATPSPCAATRWPSRVPGLGANVLEVVAHKRLAPRLHVDEAEVVLAGRNPRTRALRGRDQRATRRGLHPRLRLIRNGCRGGALTNHCPTGIFPAAMHSFDQDRVYPGRSPAES